MIAYKLFRVLKDGSVTSLYINKSRRLPLNKWLKAEEIPTKGYAVRKGWHCVVMPDAPHLSMKSRIWMRVEIEDFYQFNRPKSQGGQWLIANSMKILNKIDF